MSGPAAHARVAHTGTRWVAPALLILAALVLVAGDAGGRPWLAVAVILMQIALVGPVLMLLEASIDAAALVGVALVVADIVLLRTDLSTGGSICGVIGLSVVAVLLHQLALRHRDAVTRNVATNLSAIVAGCAPALLLPLRELAHGRSVIYVSVTCVAAALTVSRLSPGGGLVGAVTGLILAAAISLAFGLPGGGLDTGEALAAGLSVTVCGLLVDRAFGRIERAPQAGRPNARVAAAVSVLLPLALAAPIAYLAGRIIISSWG